MSEALEIKFARMEQQATTLAEEVKEVKQDIKNFPEMLDKKLEAHSNSLKSYFDNTVDSHLRDRGADWFASKRVERIVYGAVKVILLSFLGALIGLTAYFGYVISH